MDLRFWNRPRICTRRMILEALEERIVMDAAVDYIPQDNPFAGRQGYEFNAASDMWHQDGGRHLTVADRIMPVHSSVGDADMVPVSPALPSAAPSVASHDPLSQMFGSKGLDIVLVSTDADQFNAISHAVSNGARALVFDPHEESLQSISEKLHDLTDSVGQKIEHLAIVAPGAAGHLKIGADDITSNTVDAHQGEFKLLAQSLTSDARIDLYGCDIAQGQDGARLIHKVASATGATVWGSHDASGTVPGADWDLEVKSAADARPYMIDANALASYQIHLADPVPGPDPDHHETKNATGTYSNLELYATDTDQPLETSVTFAVTSMVPAGGTVTFNGTANEVSPGAYEQLFTYQANPAMLTGPVTINYTVTTPGFPSTGTDIAAAPDDYTVTCAAFGNVNDDGIPDIVLGTDLGAYYMINNANGTFTAPTLVPGTDGYAVTAIDLGPIMPLHVCGVVEDLVLGVNGQNQWVENLSTSVVNWGTVYPIGTAGTDIYNTTAIVVANLGNGYGYDVVEVNSDGAGAVIYPNTGAGLNYLSAAGVPIIAGGGQPSMHAVAVANVDGIAGNDVVVGVDGEQIRWHHGNNDGTVSATINYVGLATDAYNTLSLLVVDVNGDTNPDIVQGTAGDYAYVYTNGGSGSFATAGVELPDGTWAKGIQFADMNGDGFSDLLFGNLYGPNMYFLGDGTGTFDTVGIPLNTDNNSTVAISADANWWPANAGLEVVVINGSLDYDNITVPYPQRMYSWGSQSAAGVYTLTIDPYNNPPVDLINGSSNFLTNPQTVDPLTGTLVFSAANGNALTVSDPDAFSDTIVVTLTADNGNDMYVGPTVPGTVTVTGDGTGLITLTGPQTDINTALNGLLYRSHRDRYVDSEGLVMVANDQGHNASGTSSPGVIGTPMSDTERVSIAVNVTLPNAGGDAWWNEAPHNRMNGTDISPTNPLVPPATDDTGQVTFTGTTQITVWDPDAAAATDPIVVTLMPVGGDIRLTSTTPVGVVLDPLGDNTNGGLTLTGTQNAINSAISGMTFRVLPTNNGSGPASVTIISNDQGYNDHDEDGNPVQNTAYEMTDTDTIEIDTTTNPITDPWWNLAPVNYYGAFPIGPGNPGSALNLSASTGILVFDGYTAVGHANYLSVVDDAEDKAPLPRVPHDADVRTVLSVNDGILTVAPGWPGTVSVTNNGSNQVTLVGPPTDLNWTLEDLVYFSPNPSFIGGDTLLIQTNDLGHNPPDYVGPLSDIDTVSIIISAPTDGFWGRFPRR
jgi:hypothetical protein